MITGLVLGALVGCGVKTESIDIGPRSLDVRCAGSGPPAMVEINDRDWLSYWNKLSEELDDDLEICVYDRAGIRGSEPGKQPRTSLNIAEDLNKLVDALGFDEPVWLIGAGTGGLHVETEARVAEFELAGVVMLDPYLSAYELEYRELLTPEERIADNERLQQLRESGNAGFDAELSAQNLSATELEALPPMPDVPLLVLTADTQDESADLEDLWRKTHRQLAASVTDGEVHLVEDSGRRMYRTAPEPVARAIRERLSTAGDGATP